MTRIPLLPRSIRGLALLFAGVMALVTALLGGTTYWFVHEEIERQIDQRVEIETRALVDYERSYGFEALLDVIRKREMRAHPGDIGYLAGADETIGREMGYIVLDADGRRRAGSLQASMPPLGWSEFVHFTRPDGSRGIAQAMNNRLPNGAQLLVAADREIVDRMDLVLLRLFGAAFGVLLLLGAVAALAFGRIVRRRLAAVEASANAIIAGDMSQRMPLGGFGAELDRLSSILNHMLDRIAALVTNLREVSTGMAHDLRTPLSRLRAKLEQAEAMAKEPEQRELLEASTEETDKLMHLFGSLLAIAEVDRRTLRKRFGAVDLGDATAEIAEAHRAALEDAGLTLDVEVGSVVVHGDRPLLQRMIGNLLDNAIVHTPPGTRLRLSVNRVDAQAIVRVADDGPGVPERDRERVFERLVRLDKSRSKPGHGLGLSMVAAIASAHDGTAEIVPSEQGLLIEIRVPVLTPPAS